MTDIDPLITAHADAAEESLASARACVRTAAAAIARADCCTALHGASADVSVALAQCGLQISREVDDRAIDGLRLSLQLACLLCLAQSLRCSLVEVLADAAALACAPLDGGRSWPKVPSRHGLQPALCMAAVVNLDSVTSLAQSLVLERGEALTPLGHKLLAGLLVVQLARLLAHPRRGRQAAARSIAAHPRTTPTRPPGHGRCIAIAPNAKKTHSRQAMCQFSPYISVPSLKVTRMSPLP